MPPLQTKGEQLFYSLTSPTTAQVHPANFSLSKYSVFCGDTFRFIIADEKAGSEKRTFELHSALVARQSIALRNLVEGNMREATERFTILNDVDADTFLRFCEFVYTGEYNGALPTEQDVLDPAITEDTISDESTALTDAEANVNERGVEEPTAAEWPPEEMLTEGFFPFRSSKKKQKGQKVKTTLPPLSQLHFPHPLPGQFKLAGPLHGITGGDSSKKNYTPVLLSHVQLYVLAEKYDVLALKRLALNKLHVVLVNLPEHHGRHLASLIEYVYSTTPERTGGVKEPMRDLVAHYAACEVERMMGSKAFVGLLEVGGDFVKDLMEKVVLRL